MERFPNEPEALAKRKPSPILRRVPHRPASLVLTLTERANIGLAARGMLQSWSPADAKQQVAHATELARAIEAAVPRLAQLLIRLRYEEDVEAVIVYGLPSEEDVVPLVALALSCMFGVPFNYESSLAARWRCASSQRSASAQNTNTTRDEFAAHTDAPPCRRN